MNPPKGNHSATKRNGSCCVTDVGDLTDMVLREARREGLCAL